MSDVDLYHRVETPSYPAFLTPFTVFHLLTGVLPQFPVVYDFVIWFVAHGLYKLKDVADPQTTNSFGDTIASMLGFFLAWLVFGERPVPLSVVFGVAGVVAIASFVKAFVTSTLKHIPQGYVSTAGRARVRSFVNNLQSSRLSRPSLQ